MADEDRPLDPGKPYYTWSEHQGRLLIMSECCADSFSEAEELVLLEHLAKKHGQSSEAVSIKQFHGDNVWRDADGNIWEKRATPTTSSEADTDSLAHVGIDDAAAIASLEVNQ